MGRLPEVPPHPCGTLRRLSKEGRTNHLAHKGRRYEVRKIVLMATVLALTLAFAGVAYAVNLTGTTGPDRLVGTDGGRDKLEGRGGDDRLFGLGGVDALFGGFGDDLIVAGTGEDYVEAGPGDDVIYTGTRTSGDGQADEYFCGQGHDVIYLSGKDHSSLNQTTDTCEDVRHY